MFDLDKDSWRLVIHAGIVENTVDPYKNGRIQVRVPLWDGLKADKPTKDLPWSKVCEGFAGEDYGDFWRPKENDLVWIQCEIGDPSERIVGGSWYQLRSGSIPRVPKGIRVVEPFAEDSGDLSHLADGQAAAVEEAYSDPSGRPKHYIRRTPSGHIWGINECEGKEQVYFTSAKGHHIGFCDEPGNEFILVQDSHGNYLYFDTDKDDLHIRVKHNLKLSVGNDLLFRIGSSWKTQTGISWINTVGLTWINTVGGLISFTSASMSIINAATTALTGLWSWTGSLHTRDGASYDSGPSAHG